MGRRRHPRRDGLRRRVGTREPKRTFLVLCEGEKTEPGYLAALRRLPDVKDVAEVEIRVDTSHAGDAPLTLVQAAIDLKNRNDEIDEVWCLYRRRGPGPSPESSSSTGSGADEQRARCNLKPLLRNLACYALQAPYEVAEHGRSRPASSRMRWQHRERSRRNSLHGRPMGGGSACSSSARQACRRGNSIS